MVARISILLDTKTGAGFAKLVKDTESAGGAADAAEHEYSELEEQIRDAADAAARLGREADSSIGAEGGGGIAGKVTAAATSVLALKESFGAVSEVLQQMAEEGDPAVQELVDSFGDLRTAAFSIARDPVIQDWLQSIARITREEVAPALAELPEKIRSFRDRMAEGAIQVGQDLGIVRDDVRRIYAEMTEAERKLRDEQRETMRLREEANRIYAQQQDFEKGLGQIREQLEHQRFNQHVAEIEDRREINALLEKEIKFHREAAEAGALPAQDRAEALQRIAVLEQRRLQIIEEEKDAAIAAAEEEKQARIAAAEEWQRTVRAAQKSLEAEREREMQKQRAQVEQMRRELEGGGTIDKLKGGFTDREVLEQIIKQRQEEGVTSRSGRQLSDRDIRRQAFQQARRGMIGGDEVGMAQNQLLTASVQNAQQTGQISNTMAQAIQQSVKTMQENARATEEHQQQIEQLTRSMQSIEGALNDTGRRARAQRSSRGR